MVLKSSKLLLLLLLIILTRRAFFPLGFIQRPKRSSPAYTIPVDQNTIGLEKDLSLPPNDPFLNQELPEPNLNNTDELMEILSLVLGHKQEYHKQTLISFLLYFGWWKYGHPNQNPDIRGGLGNDF